MKRIKKLTEEQIARMSEYRDKWMKFGLSTDPSCREKAEAAIRTCYEKTSELKPTRMRVHRAGFPLLEVLV